MWRVISPDSFVRSAGAHAIFTVVERLCLLYTRNIIAIGAFNDSLTTLIFNYDDLLFIPFFRHSMFDNNTKFQFSLFQSFFSRRMIDFMYEVHRYFRLFCFVPV